MKIRPFDEWKKLIQPDPPTIVQMPPTIGPNAKATMEIGKIDAEIKVGEQILAKLDDMLTDDK